jgi:hypothetical protein
MVGTVVAATAVVADQVVAATAVVADQVVAATAVVLEAVVLMTDVVRRIVAALMSDCHSWCGDGRHGGERNESFCVTRLHSVLPF